LGARPDAAPVPVAPPVSAVQRIYDRHA
jgi:hypothetical protein